SNFHRKHLLTKCEYEATRCMSPHGTDGPSTRVAQAQNSAFAGSMHVVLVVGTAHDRRQLGWMRDRRSVWCMAQDAEGWPRPQQETCCPSLRSEPTRKSHLARHCCRRCCFLLDRSRSQQDGKPCQS